MKRLLLLLLLIIPLVSAAWDVSPLQLSVPGGIAQNQASGWRAIALQNISVSNITIVSGVTANNVAIYNDSGFLLNQSLLVGNMAFINATLVQGSGYRFLVNSTNGSGFTHMCGSSSDVLPALSTGIFNWTNGTFSNVNTLTGPATFCNIQRVDFTGDAPGILYSNFSFANASSYDTASEFFSSNFSSSQSIVSAILSYGSSLYTAAVTNYASEQYAVTRKIDIPLGVGYKNWFWNITYSNGTTVRSESTFQSVANSNLTLCAAAPQDRSYINFTFKNETLAQENVNATITSEWNYYLGSGTVNRTLTYSTVTENPSYAFCFSPQNRTVYADPNVQYGNINSQLRTYNPTALTLNNITTNKTLWLLPTSEGIFVTFQVVNVGGQVLSDTIVNTSRSSYGLISEQVTGATGTATFFLDPDITYTACFNYPGLPISCVTDVFSQTSYTITLGSSTTTNVTDYGRGISYSINPSQFQLSNQTTYNFNFTIASTFWDLDSYGFTLTNQSGFVMASASGSTGTGGFTGVNLNTGLNSSIFMNAFWLINGTYTNVSRNWIIINPSDTQWSLDNFFTRLSTYINNPSDSDGLFGLKGQTFSLSIIIFLVIFVATGIMSYKFGVSSPTAVMMILFGLVFFFDIQLELLPRPASNIPITTIFIGVILSGVLFREMYR